MRSPESSLDMRKSELSPEVRSYIENLTEQIGDIPKSLGFKNLVEMQNALDHSNDKTFERESSRREQIYEAVDKLAALIEARRNAKDTGKLPEIEKKDNEPFDPDDWQPEDFPAAEKFLRENLDKIEKEKRIEAQQIGGKTRVELIADLQKAGMKTTAWSSFLLDSENFTTLEEPEEIITIRLTVTDLGFTKNATTAEIYARAKELGLELCPAETGLHYRLSHPDQPVNDYVAIAMEPVAVLDGDLSVFRVHRSPDGLFLSARDAGPDYGWNPEDRFLFRLRKKTD